MSTRSTSEMNAIKNYAARVSAHSTAFALELKTRGKTRNSQTGELLIQIIGFYYILFVKEAEAGNISSSKVGSTINDVSRIVCQTIFNTGHINPNEAYRTLQGGIGEILEKYVHIALSAPPESKGLGGSLLWEYSKLIADTTGKSNDPMTITSIANLLVNTAKLVDAGELVDALNGKVVSLAPRPASQAVRHLRKPRWHKPLKLATVVAVVILAISWIDGSSESSSRCRNELEALKDTVARSESYLKEMDNNTRLGVEYYNEHIPKHNQYVKNYNTRLAECK